MFFQLGSWPKAIVHIDGDAFFASCEQAMHPEYRGRPVVTGKERGIVAAASYEAKGINRGVPLWKVKKICPDAIIVPSDYETYSLFSKRMFNIMRRFTSDVEEYSIDEAFADITGLQRPLHLSYEKITEQIKNTIERELGITVSAGLSVSKVLAKLGSKFKKPSGLTIIPSSKIEHYLALTPIEKIWGIGPRTTAYMEKFKIKTALDFALKNKEFVDKYFTKPHQEIWLELKGESVYEVTSEEKSNYASIGKTKTFTPASSNEGFVFAHLLKNIENACIKARRHNLAATSLIIYLKKQNFKTVGIEGKLSRASAYPEEIMTIVKKLFQQIYKNKELYRATGIVLTNLQSANHVQYSLFDPPIKIKRLEKLYEAIDKLGKKYGKHAIHLAGSDVAHTTRQHTLDRGDVPLRQLNRVKGETKRKHLAIPLLLKNIS